MKQQVPPKSLAGFLKVFSTVLKWYGFLSKVPGGEGWGWGRGQLLFLFCLKDKRDGQNQGAG